MTDSQTLLAEYVRTGSETAFRELVVRYVDLVHSTALRLVKGDTHRAEDVAQTVFMDLARMARTLSSDVMLGGWLHRHTCFVAANTMRGERRRQSRERQAVEMNALQSNPDADFSLVAPFLDEAINELGDADRTAVLLRFFAQHDFRSVGEALGSNEDAARMRVTRALEKLEHFLKRRGVTTSAATLGLVLGANAVQAAPVGLAVTISTAAALTGTITATATTATATKIIVMTTLQKALITTIVVTALAIGTGAYIVHQRNADRLRVESETNLSKESWSNAGFATPQATLRTIGWAVLNGDRERFKQCLSMTDGARSMIEQMIAASPGSDAEKKLHPELLTMTAEDAMLFPMMAQNKKSGFTGYRILSQRSLSADEMLFEVETQMATAPVKKQSFKFRRIGSDWKVLIDEDSMKED